VKLRIKGSSLRLRLTQGEVQQLDMHGEVAEQVHFAPGTVLTYRILIDKNNKDITASYAGNLIDIRIPESMAREWSRSEAVTLSRDQPITAVTAVSGSAPGELRVVIEKDWACLAPRPDEDESDHFPHPDVPGGRTC